MIINSITFLIFFSVVFVLYYIGQKSRCWQQCVLLLASSIFYAWTNWKMLLLLSTSIFVFYGLALSMERYKSERIKNILCALGVIIGVGILLYFKYLNFFIDSFVCIFTKIGLECNLSTFKIVMPLGISFFTFKLISYIIDVRRGETPICKNIIILANYISFFPTILSGPIDKASNLLPQFEQAHCFNYSTAVDGCRQILWGMFKKMVIADGLSIYTMTNPETAVGSTLFILSVYYSIQLYCDFSGYSDMAIGIGKLLGFNIISNFRYPYFANSIAEFWKRWHISLLNWFRYYIYIPLGGSRCSKVKVIRNTFIIFLVSGLWHGANWTFILWGVLHAIFFLPILLNNSPRPKVNLEEKIKINIHNIINIITVFLLVNFAWIIFHSANIEQAMIIFSKIFSSSIFSKPVGVLPALPILLFSLGMFIYELKASDKEYALKVLPKNKILRWSLYILIVLLIVFYQGKPTQFIYFSF